MVGTGYVLATLYRAVPDAPSRGEPTEVTRDLSLWAGQTVRLRFPVGENQAPLRAGVDDIKFEPIR